MRLVWAITNRCLGSEYHRLPKSPSTRNICVHSVNSSSKIPYKRTVVMSIVIHVCRNLKGIFDVLCSRRPLICRNNDECPDTNWNYPSLVQPLYYVYYTWVQYSGKGQMNNVIVWGPVGSTYEIWKILWRRHQSVNWNGKCIFSPESWDYGKLTRKKGKKKASLLYETNHLCTSARKTEEIYGTQSITNRLKCNGPVCSNTKNIIMKI